MGLVSRDREKITEQMNHATNLYKEHNLRSVHAENDRRGTLVHYLYEPGDGGLDRVAILLANGMAERGRPTELWMTESDGPVASLISSKVTVRIVPSLKFGSRGMRIMMQIPALAKMIAKHRPAVVMSAGNQSNLSIALARSLAGASNTKIVQKITNPIDRSGMNDLRGRIRAARFGLTVKLGDLCLTLSEAEATIYCTLLPAVAERFHAVHNAYVTQEMLAIGEMRRSSESSKPPHLLAIGRMTHQKDYGTMFRALSKLVARPWTMSILGEGPLLGQMKAFSRELQIHDRIEFAGFVRNPASYLSSADLLILSSRWEGFPAVPLEAMAAGCGVVATDCSPGLSALLAQMGQKTTPVGDANALSDAISVMLDFPSETAAGCAIAACYGIESSVNDHLGLIDELIS